MDPERPVSALILCRTSKATMVAGLALGLTACGHVTEEQSPVGICLATPLPPRVGAPDYGVTTMPSTSMAPDSATIFCGYGAVCPVRGQPLYGQDGNYQLRVPHYVRSVDVVHDDVTGLDWGATDGVFFTARVEEAVTHCRELDLGGTRGWRLPNRRELVSIVDYGDGYVFGLGGAATTSSPGGRYWLASEVGDTSAPRVIDSYGNVTVFDVGAGYTLPGARCVRGDRTEPDHRVSTDGFTVLDVTTGLEWQRDVQSLPTMTIACALSYCEGLELAGSGHWRLPSVKELQSLVHERATEPFIDDVAFPSTPGPMPFLSSSPSAQFPDDSRFWTVGFFGYEVEGKKYEAGTAMPWWPAAFHVRCVR